VLWSQAFRSAPSPPSLGERRPPSSAMMVKERYRATQSDQATAARLAARNPAMTCHSMLRIVQLETQTTSAGRACGTLWQ